MQSEGSISLPVSPQFCRRRYIPPHWLRVRQLSLAGIGLIWLFNVGTGVKPALPHPLLQGALFIFLALFFDLLQYLVGTFTWFVYFRNKERAGTPPEEEFLAPAWINWPTWALFCVKAACMLIAYLGSGWRCRTASRKRS